MSTSTDHRPFRLVINPELILLPHLIIWLPRCPPGDARSWCCLAWALDLVTSASAQIRAWGEGGGTLQSAEYDQQLHTISPRPQESRQAQVRIRQVSEAGCKIFNLQGLCPSMPSISTCHLTSFYCNPLESVCNSCNLCQFQLFFMM